MQNGVTSKHLDRTTIPGVGRGNGAIGGVVIPTHKGKEIAIGTKEDNETIGSRNQTIPVANIMDNQGLKLDTARDAGRGARRGGGPQ